ncbi:MAG: sialidase family protein [Kineosporiaceae bacterium]
MRHVSRRLRTPSIVTIAAAAVLATASTASSAVISISSDQYTNTDSQHATQVEPDSFAWGNTVVTAVQTGRFFNGGASNINVSTSTDGGATWTSQGLPNLTNNAPVGGGSFDRVSDPVVAYDAKHNVWLVSTLPLIGRSSTTGPAAAGVYTSRSTNGGLAWGNPILVTGSNSGSPDKNWVVCDNTATSPFYGNCYTEWDDNADSNRIYMSTSTDGGLTWGAAKRTANNGTGIGGQPLVQPNGTVIVPIDNANETALLSFRSTDGGATWSSTASITRIQHHTVAGSLRTGPLPSAEIDASGKVYVAWQDCRFRKRCTANDIVFVTSTNGTTWSTIQRVPIDATNSGVDHFIPGLAVNPATSGATAKLALAYYSYPAASCTAATCQLRVGYISSGNGGTTWTAPQQLAGPMSLSWLPNTSQGRMVGDYISTSFVNGTPIPVFTTATANSGTVFNQFMAASTGLTALAGAAAVDTSPRNPTNADANQSSAHSRRH